MGRVGKVVVGWMSAFTFNIEGMSVEGLKGG